MQNHNGFIKEIKYRYLISPYFLDDGFIPFTPEFDTGVDLIIYRERDDLLIKLQLKSRWTIHKKYEGRGIAMAFPDRGDFYLIPHDLCIDYAKTQSNFLNTSSWKDKGIYHMASMSLAMREHFAPFCLKAGGDNEDTYSYYRKNQSQ